jgi:hypothetical protein
VVLLAVDYVLVAIDALHAAVHALGELARIDLPQLPLVLLAVDDDGNRDLVMLVLMTFQAGFPVELRRRSGQAGGGNTGDDCAGEQFHPHGERTP